MAKSLLAEYHCIETVTRSPALTGTAQHTDFTPTILVADDDDDIRDLITFKLQMAGYRVLTADNGHSALHIIETRLPDAVILDVGMPGMAGFSVATGSRLSAPPSASP